MFSLFQIFELVLQSLSVNESVWFKLPTDEEKFFDKNMKKNEEKLQHQKLNFYFDLGDVDCSWIRISCRV